MDDLVAETLPVRCPFCFASLAVTHEPPSVLHGLPMCAAFLANEPDVYLRKVREALEGV